MNSRGRTLERINAKKKRSSSEPPSKSTSEHNTSQIIRKAKPLPPWDDSVNDLSVYKLSQEEVVRNIKVPSKALDKEKRRLSLKSGNLPLARAELRQKFGNRDEYESDNESDLRRSSKVHDILVTTNVEQFEVGISKEDKESLTPIIQRQKSQAWAENKEEAPYPSIDFNKIDFSRFLQKLATNIATEAEEAPAATSSRPSSANKKKKERKSKKQTTSTVILDSDLEKGPVNIPNMEDQIRELEHQRLADSFNPRLSASLPPKPPTQKATITTTSRPPVPPHIPTTTAPSQPIEQSNMLKEEDMAPLDMKYLRSDSEYYKTVIDNLTSHLIQSELQLKQQKEERAILQDNLAEHKVMIDKLSQRVSHFELLEEKWNSKLEELLKEISQLRTQQQELQTLRELSAQHNESQQPPKTPLREDYPPRPFMELNSPIDAYPMNPQLSVEVPMPLRSPVQAMQYSPTDSTAPYRVSVPYQRPPYPARGPVMVQRPMTAHNPPPHIMRPPAPYWNPSFPPQEAVAQHSIPIASQDQENLHPNQVAPPNRIPVSKPTNQQVPAASQPAIFQAPVPQRPGMYAGPVTAKSITVESKPTEKFAILDVRPQTIPSTKPAPQTVPSGQPARKAVLTSTAKMRS